MSALRDSACCGENLKTDRISLAGVLTFCFPLALLLIAASPAIALSSFSAPGRALAALKRANERLIADSPIFPSLRSRSAGWVFRFSPRLSGFVFRNFNFALCLSLAAAAALGLDLWIRR